MNLPLIAILAGFMLLAACATPAPEPQGDAPPEPVPAGITPLTQEQDELFGAIGPSLLPQDDERQKGRS
jgi:hypothetical protein